MTDDELGAVGPTDDAWPQSVEERESDDGPDDQPRLPGGGHSVLDVSRYPVEVPTVREQLRASAIDADDVGSRKDVERLTSIGILSNPLAHRRHLEDHYEATTPSDRTRRWAVKSGDGFVTPAHLGEVGSRRGGE